MLGWLVGGPTPVCISNARGTARARAIATIVSAPRKRPFARRRGVPDAQATPPRRCLSIGGGCPSVRSFVWWGVPAVSVRTRAKERAARSTGSCYRQLPPTHHLTHHQNPRDSTAGYRFDHTPGSGGYSITMSSQERHFLSPPPPVATIATGRKIDRNRQTIDSYRTDKIQDGKGM